MRVRGYLGGRIERWKYAFSCLFEAPLVDR